MGNGQTKEEQLYQAVQSGNHGTVKALRREGASLEVTSGKKLLNWVECYMTQLRSLGLAIFKQNLSLLSSHRSTCWVLWQGEEERIGDQEPGEIYVCDVFFAVGWQGRADTTHSSLHTRWLVWDGLNTPYPWSQFEGISAWYVCCIQTLSLKMHAISLNWAPIPWRLGLILTIMLVVEVNFGMFGFWDSFGKCA